MSIHLDRGSAAPSAAKACEMRASPSAAKRVARLAAPACFAQSVPGMGGSAANAATSAPANAPLLACCSDRSWVAAQTAAPPTAASALPPASSQWCPDGSRLADASGCQPADSAARSASEGEVFDFFRSLGKKNAKNAIRVSNVALHKLITNTVVRRWKGVKSPFGFTLTLYRVVETEGAEIAARKCRTGDGPAFAPTLIMEVQASGLPEDTPTTGLLRRWADMYWTLLALEYGAGDREIGIRLLPDLRIAPEDGGEPFFNHALEGLAKLVEWGGVQTTFGSAITDLQAAVDREGIFLPWVKRFESDEGRATLLEVLEAASYVLSLPDWLPEEHTESPPRNV